jgi:predicted ATPase
MKLVSLEARRYRSLKSETVPFDDLNVFIGPNGSGKSTILDALRFLQEGVRARDFREAVALRGGILHLAWKGEDAGTVELRTRFVEDDASFKWVVRLTRRDYDFSVHEEVFKNLPGAPPSQVLAADDGNGWWWSEGKRVPLRQHETTCALASAAADATFPARSITEFVRGWGFFDPNPFTLRRAWAVPESDRLDGFGRNLAERLFAMQKSAPASFERVVAATRSVLGFPAEIEPRESEGRFYFAQIEPGLKHPVHQVGASSGTLRMLALMTALFEGADSSLVGIEEPENHIHPAALSAFAEFLLQAREEVQVLITTHSPLLLDYLDEPSAVRLVRRDEQEGTRVTPVADPVAVRTALEESGFALGEFYQTKGFGG